MLYPQLSAKRKVYDLNGLWQFKQGNYAPNGQNRLSDDPESELMVVPTSFNDVLVDKDKRLFIGDNWYERVIDLPEIAEDEEAVLRFGSVTHQAKVYLNGRLAGEHKGGFTPFEVVLTEKDLAEKPLVLSVCANNELNYTTLPVGNYLEKKMPDGRIKKVVKENFDFFNYAGIHRPVKLYTRPKHHIEDIIVQYELSDDLKSAEVMVKVEAGAVSKVVVSILDETGKVLAQGAPDQALVLESVTLWQPLKAYLYTCRVELFDGDKLVDRYDEAFGIRKVEVKNAQFLINDQPFYFKGFGKHEDTYINGRGLNEAANLMDLNLLKDIGANSFRTSHYPYSEEMMRLADRMGIVVIDEVPAVGLFQNFTAALDLLGDKAEPDNTWTVMKTKEAHEAVIRELVKRDKNHACVVMWVVANEPSSHEAGAREYFESLIQLYRDLDQQKRPVTLVNIMMAMPGKDLVADLIDVICLNRYYGWYKDHAELEDAKVHLKQELEDWHRLYPDKPIMFTEYGADTLPGYHSLWDIPYTEEYQCDYYKANHEVFDSLPYFVGEQVWNFADFETNVSLIRVKGNHKGLFSRNRDPKQVVRLFKERWTAIPNLGYKP
ncbi:beta-glucuronidase [Streptococcus ovuberis]|uniref:Beta-glucuronidase n=1 Tax=Streptococcus ovuberis TaxID=1936207 RepID=A0A7X6RZS1_9STRE|nr:beta-glucuronidase [Streptococcus ovuberis]NKZ19443.1 beta-glucuronidase [Streptococcus ovuberis]